MENEYPLVERFMYLFMVVLQVSIFSPNDTILAQEDIHLALLSTNFSPPPLTSTNLGLSTLLGISLFFRLVFTINPKTFMAFPPLAFEISSEGGLVATSNINWRLPTWQHRSRRISSKRRKQLI